MAKKKRNVGPKMPVENRSPVKKMPSIKRGDHKQVLIELYAAQDVSIGSLPYTEEFTLLCIKFREATGRGYTDGKIWRTLNNLSRHSKLPNKEHEKPAPKKPKVKGIMEILKDAK